jgi:hypothetical protein
MKRFYILLMLAASALTLSGQNTFSGPASGYVFDSEEHSIRAIVGVPGAAYLGAQPDSPPEPPWDSVSVAPSGKRALGMTGLSVNLIPDLSQPASFISIAQASGPISRIAWSGDSTTAAIWSPASGQLQRITGLDSAPIVHNPIDLTALAGILSGWSLSPDGNSIALSSPASGTASVYLSDRDAAPVSIGSLADPGAIAFSVDGTSLFVFDSVERKILLLALPSGAIAGSFDASPFDAAAGVAVARPGIRGTLPGRLPRATGVQDLAASADGGRLYAISGKTLCGYDLRAGQAPSCGDLAISPSSFQPMPGGLLLLNYLRSRNMPLWLLNGKTGQTYFVPSGSATADASF